MVFLIHTELRCTVNHTSDIQLLTLKRNTILNLPAEPSAAAYPRNVESNDRTVSWKNTLAVETAYCDIWHCRRQASTPQFHLEWQWVICVHMKRLVHQWTRQHKGGGKTRSPPPHHPFVPAFIDMSLSTKVHIQGTMYPSLKSLPLQNICNLLSSRYMVLSTFIYLFSSFFDVSISSMRPFDNYLIFFFHMSKSFQSSSINPFSPIDPLILSAQVVLGLPHYLLPGGIHFITFFFVVSPLPFSEHVHTILVV